MKSVILKISCLGIVVVMCLMSKMGWAETVTATTQTGSSYQAEITPARVHLTTLTDELLANNPEIQAAKAQREAAQKRVSQSWALPDPMAGLDLMGHETETRAGPQEHRFVISQKIPFPLKLWEKRKVAQQVAEAAEQQYFAIQRDMKTQLHRAFYSLYETDAALEAIHEIHQLLKKFEGVAQARFSNRQGTQRDVAKAQAEVSLTLEQVYQLEQQRETLAAFINAILNRSLLDPLGKAVAPEIPSEKRSLPELITLASRHRQEIKVMEAMVEKSQHSKNLAKLDWIPDVDVGFSYTFVGAGDTTSNEDGKDSWMIPLRFNIPLWQNRLIPALQEAQKEVEAAQAKLLSSQNETFYETKDAYVRYQTATKIATLYETAVIPQAKLALSSDQAGYESGEVDFLNLLDSERIYLNAKLTHIKIYAEALRSYADLERATGMNGMEVSNETQ